MRIAIADLRRVTDQLLSYIEHAGVDVVDIDKDFYWSVPAPARYDKYDEPRELDVGQLTEDWDRLMLISQEKMPPVPAAVGWLGEVLVALSDQPIGGS